MKSKVFICLWRNDSLKTFVTYLVVILKKQDKKSVDFTLEHTISLEKKKERNEKKKKFQHTIFFLLLVLETELYLAQNR